MSVDNFYKLNKTMRAKSLSVSKAKMFLKNSSLLILISTFSITIGFSQNDCLININHPGYKTIVQTTGAVTIERGYILHVPINHNIDNNSSLILNLHGFGDCASNFAKDIGENYNFNELADEENILVAYPQGAYRSEKDSHYWEPGDNGSLNIIDNDVFFLEQLAIEISNEYNIDMNKIYAIGYSNGGMMAYSLACNKSDLFSGIGIMSGVMLEEECTLQNSIPIITFHGIDDEVLPYDGNLWYQSVSEIVNFWLDKNNISQSSLVSTELNNGNVIKDEYSNTNENSCLQLYTIREEWDKPGGHVWFSEEINGQSPNKIMWDFFNDNCGAVTTTKEALSKDEEVIVNPNPFSDNIIIESDSKLNRSYTIYNIEGDRIKSGIVNSKRHRIELASLPPNIYILNIDGIIRKLIKTN